MSELFWLIMFIPLMFPFLGKIIFKYKIQYSEMVIQFGIVLLAGWTIYSVGKYNAMVDVEVWNGQILEKNAQTEECDTRWRRSSHWFCTNNRTRQVQVGQTCDGDGNCSPVYATEYKNIYDWERRYFVTSSFGKHEVPRVDRQGVNYPELFTSTNIGDPASKANTFENYVKAASGSLFNFEQGLVSMYEENIPVYPNRLHDIWKVNRIFSIGVNLSDINQWNFDLGMILREAGPQRQANAVIIIHTLNGELFPNAVIQSWQGGKKNDTLLFIEVDDLLKIRTVRVHSWSKNEYYNLALRDAISEIGILNREQVIQSLHYNLMNHFERRSMKEFEYLLNEIEPSKTSLIVLFIFVTLFSGLLTYGFSRINLNQVIAELFTGLRR